MFNLPAPHDIRYFVEIAETSNVSRAAEKLGVRQPTLSLAIKRLEAALEVELFVRSKQGVQLTHAGRRFLSESRRLLEQWNEIRQLTRREDVEITGRYSLGAHPSVALSALPQLLPRLLETFREVELQLVHDRIERHHRPGHRPANRLRHCRESAPSSGSHHHSPLRR